MFLIIKKQEEEAISALSHRRARDGTSLANLTERQERNIDWLRKALRDRHRWSGCGTFESNGIYIYIYMYVYVHIHTYMLCICYIYIYTHQNRIYQISSCTRKRFWHNCMLLCNAFYHIRIIAIDRTISKSSTSRFSEAWPWVRCWWMTSQCYRGLVY